MNDSKFTNKLGELFSELANEVEVDLKLEKSNNKTVMFEGNQYTYKILKDNGDTLDIDIGEIVLMNVPRECVESGIIPFSSNEMKDVTDILNREILSGDIPDDINLFFEKFLMESDDPNTPIGKLVKFSTTDNKQLFGMIVYEHGEYYDIFSPFGINTTNFTVPKSNASILDPSTDELPDMRELSTGDRVIDDLINRSLEPNTDVGKLVRYNIGNDKNIIGIIIDEHGEYYDIEFNKHIVTDVPKDEITIID